MKNFIVIMMVMVAVVYTSPHSHRELLELIRDEANTTNKTLSEDERHKFVPVASGSPNRCWPHFFCLAEKSLADTQLSKLKHLIHQYNKNHNVSCQLKENQLYTLQTLLTDIMTCTRHFRGCQKGWVHMKEKS